MGKRKIRVKVPGYRKPSIRKRVKGYSYMRKDVGAPGRTPKAKRWFVPTRETGWRKSLPAHIRRGYLYIATDERLTKHNRLVQAGRMIQSLANVTTDRATKKAARADAGYFFRRARGVS